MAQLRKRKYYTEFTEVMDLPPLNNLQIDSYNWFLKTGFRELLEEISPIQDFTGKLLELAIEDYFFDEPAVDETTARERNLTYKAPMRAKLKLTNKETGEIKETEVFFGEFPLMTDQGTFVVNGIERVVVAQIVRSPGVLFVAEESEGQRYYGAKIIPVRGAWLEIETNKRGIIWVKIDRKRKVPVTTLLRAMGFGSDEEIRKQFEGVIKDPAYDFIEKTLERDPAKSYETGIVEVYKKVRPGDLATIENAKQLILAMFFDFRRYDLGAVGRYKINQRLGLDVPIDRKNRVLLPTDLVAIVKEIINLAQTEGEPDDIDHLGNRRVRAVGELLQGKIRVGLLRMERIVKDRMSVSDLASVTPAQLINVHPVTAALQEFFASSQLSQFMDQTNPLAELEHKRRISAMGPGGLSRERASFEVRDVHTSHYGRICPIETPEGPNVGLVGDLASYAHVNKYGFIETPYRVVKHKDGKSFATSDIVYLDANEDQKAIISQAALNLAKNSEILDKRVEARFRGEPEIVSVDKLEYMDVSPIQTVAVATGLIPFMEHDESARASMGANMLRQAVPLIRPDSPIVGTGLEERAAMDSGNVVLAENPGVVVSSTAQHVKIMEKNGKERIYHLKNFVRSNQALGIHQRPVVERGQKVLKGDLLADSFSTDNGELALGQNVTVAFMPMNGGNFEDAVLISEKLVEQDRYTSIHIDNFRIEVRDTKLGPEVVTRDIPNVGEEALKNLDEEGIVRIGAGVSSGDILVGKITPKGETELTAEEKLLRAIFGEKARDVKDTSLRLPHGEYGRVVDIKIFSRDLGDELAAGVIQAIEVSVAQLRKITVGDKMAGRHGNKGVISKVVPVEDMPYMLDGTPVDIVLNPLGIVSRMNIGQVLETHLGWAAKMLGYKVASPVFQGVSIEIIEEEMQKAGLPVDGKVELFDGKTGRKFVSKICVGVIYMMKLIHLVEDKIHARSTGPYATITQQPLGGKAQFGGQRFGEMEVWALQAYGASHTLQEMLTIKSDDVLGRSKAYEAIIKDEAIKKPATPESFNVLTRELQSLGLKVDLLKKVSPAKVKEVELQSVAEKEEEMRGTAVISADDVAEETAKMASEPGVVEIEAEREDIDKVDVGVEE